MSFFYKKLVTLFNKHEFIQPPKIAAVDIVPVVNTIKKQ